MANKTKINQEPIGNHETDELELRTVAITELRMAGAEPGAEGETRSRTVEGYAAVYGVWADMGWMKEQIVAGAFRSALEDSDIRALFNHNRDQILAREKSKTLTVWEDTKGLGFRFDIPESRNDILEAIERGDVDECSFAFRVKAQRWVWTEEGEPDERYIEEFRAVQDISLVTFPAYDNTSVALRSKKEYRAKQEKENKPDEDLGIMKMKLSLHRHSI